MKTILLRLKRDFEHHKIKINVINNPVKIFIESDRDFIKTFNLLKHHIHHNSDEIKILLIINIRNPIIR